MIIWLHLSLRLSQRSLMESRRDDGHQKGPRQSVSEKGEDQRMAREQQQIAEEPMRKRKSVRFGECPDPGSSGGPVGVVPSLVPHLPGLDPDALYVISGPFPQYDEGSGISNMVK